MNFSAWAIRRPVPALLLFIVLTLAGWFSFKALSVQNLPDLDLPTVTVTAALPGATASTMETEVTRKIEDGLATVEKVQHITSTISEGASVTTVQFDLEKGAQEAVDDVRDAVSRVRGQLPVEVQEPVIARMNVVGQALLTYAVRAEAKTPSELSWFVDNEVSKQLLAVPGVGKVTRQGGVAREVQVELDPARMAALDVSAAEVSSQLRAAAQDASGGRTEFANTEQSVRALGAVSSVEELKALPLVFSGKRKVLLSEIATVRDATAEPRQAAVLDGKPVVAFQVYRASGTSEVTVAAAVRARMLALSKSHPEVRVTEIGNSVQKVQDQYDASMKALYEGAFLAVVVVWLFLRDWRATLVSAVALPLSVIPTFFAMKLFGFSLNTITLLALTLVVGILVDDAIVEVENIVRHLQMGKPPKQAALDAATEIGLAVVATSLTLVAVFLPTAFMSGVPGKFFKQFGWTAALAVLASLLVARLLTPMMAAKLMKPHHTQPVPGKMANHYHRALQACVRHPGRTVAASVGFFVVSLALGAMLPSGFLPAADQGKVQVSVELAPGATLADTLQVVEAVRAKAQQLPAVTRVYALAGAGEVRKGQVSLDIAANRQMTQAQAEAWLRTALAGIPGARFSFGAGQSGEKLVLILAGDNPHVLAQTAQAVEAELRTIPGLGNVSSSASLLRPELVIRPDLARAADLGVSAQTVGQAVRVATAGDFDNNLAKLNLAERQLPIRVALAREHRADPEVVGQLRVRTQNGSVPLSSFAQLSVESGPAQIDRYDRRRNVALSVELAGAPLGQVMEKVEALPTLKNLPEGVSRQASGDMERMAELFSNFLLAMFFGVLSVYFVLALLFHDFVQPITILAALPLSIGGAFAALLIGGYALTMPALIGLLMLMGVVTKNSILLVEYAERLRREQGENALAAVVEACRTRARPIVMTTIAMAAGMVPLVWATQGDSSFRAPMAAAVLGGLATSTVLSLLVVPAVYVLIDAGRARISRKWGQPNA